MGHPVKEKGCVLPFSISSSQLEELNVNRAVSHVGSKNMPHGGWATKSRSLAPWGCHTSLDRFHPGGYGSEKQSPGLLKPLFIWVSVTVTKYIYIYQLCTICAHVYTNHRPYDTCINYGEEKHNFLSTLLGSWLKHHL